MKGDENSALRKKRSLISNTYAFKVDNFEAI